MNSGGESAAGVLGVWRADPLRLGIAALLLLLAALVGAAIVMFATPPPQVADAPPPRVADAASAAGPRPSPAAETAPAAVRAPGGPVGQTVAGPAQVVDTATLRVRDRVVTLKGVRGEGGVEARDMAGWLAGREVRCERVAAEFHRCAVDGWDLAEVVLFNGGGRAAPDASPAQRKAERQARDARRGIWATR